MIVFTHPRESDHSERIVALFGTGLIGSAICNRMNQLPGVLSSFFPFRWDDPDQSRRDANAIYDYLSSLLLTNTGANRSPRVISIIWCAGRAGFDASKSDMDKELVSYSIVLDLLSALMEASPEIDMNFHLFSSAGGLFEGQRFIGAHSTPKPLRYYGHLKFEQEKTLINMSGQIRKSIYRLTSAYGYVGAGQRMGLIPTLVSNGLKNQVSTIFGNISTLRDYVFNNDIASYLVSRLHHPANRSDTNTYYLGSGKPSSIYEVIYFVEKIIGKKLLMQFQMNPRSENILNISLNPSILPSNWRPTDLYAGIRSVKESILSGDRPILETVAWENECV